MRVFIKIFLFPFAVIYGAIIWLRNWMYKSNFIGSTDFEIPVISVGNLSVGGTGKTPFVEMLIELLHPKYMVGVLSRGYKRKSTGYRQVMPNNTAEEVGDEPLMIKLKYRDAHVSVGEQRVIAIPHILSQHPDIKVILLDDAFQHQSVRPDINILLTTYDKPFWKDSILPMGTLREFISGKDRANIIVVTKCPATISEEEQRSIIQQIDLRPNQKVFFAAEEYGIPYNLLNPDDRSYFSKNNAELLITGIANAAHIKSFIEDNAKELVHFEFDDHHFFNRDELDGIQKNYPDFRKWITTEKDGVRLALHKDWFIRHNISLYCLPVRTKIVGIHKDDFAPTITGFLKFFYKEEEREEETQD